MSHNCNGIFAKNSRRQQSSLDEKTILRHCSQTQFRLLSTRCAQMDVRSRSDFLGPPPASLPCNWRPQTRHQVCWKIRVFHTWNVLNVSRLTKTASWFFRITRKKTTHNENRGKNSRISLSTVCCTNNHTYMHVHTIIGRSTTVDFFDF